MFNLDVDHLHFKPLHMINSWNAKCPFFLGNFTPLKPATLALKNSAQTAFQVDINCNSFHLKLDGNLDQSH